MDCSQGRDGIPVSSSPTANGEEVLILSFDQSRLGEGANFETPSTGQLEHV
jgi:hypothetical protein